MNRLDRRRELPVTALILAVLLSAGLGRPAAAGPAQALVLEQKIPLGAVHGRIDPSRSTSPGIDCSSRSSATIAWASWI
jgi:hypothetical protein